MAEKSPTWHGIPRQEIPWYPTVNTETCIGCELCYVTCGRNVFEMKDRKSIAAHPLECMVGCSTCAIVCPVEAISFPARDLIWKTEREHKIFRMVHEEAHQKREKLAAQQARAVAEETLAQRTTQVRVEVSGEFGEKRFLVKLEELRGCRYARSARSGRSPALWYHFRPMSLPMRINLVAICFRGSSMLSVSDSESVMPPSRSSRRIQPNPVGRYANTTEARSLNREGG